MQGHSLQEVIRTDTPVREDALFGVFGGHVCVTDGRYVYMRGIGEGGKNEPLYQYTYMPMHLYNLFSVPEMRTVELAEPFFLYEGLQTDEDPQRQMGKKRYSCADRLCRCRSYSRKPAV